MRVDSKMGRQLAAPIHKREYERKLVSGEYVREPTDCICGDDSANDFVIAETDRAGMTHRMVLCKACALMRANPRLTKESYRQFYNNEYRYIYAQRGGAQTVEDEFQGKVKIGEGMQEWLDEMDIPSPKVVIDFGCYVGGFVRAFENAGAEAYGVEWDLEAVEFARGKGLNIVTSVQELKDRGIKADLIILHDAIEHLTDLHTVEELGKLLTPEGFLYVYTPGFFRNNVNSYFQVAHTYQFCARSLEYVMDRLGFEEYYSDEEILSLWQYRGAEFRLRPLTKPTEWSEFIMDHLFKPDGIPRRSPRFRGVCKFSPKLLFANMKANLALKVPDISEITGTQKGPAMILAGGPSVDEQIDNIKWLKGCGYPLIAIARMYPWCLDRGIIPDYVLTLDCSEEQEPSFVNMQDGTTFLAASVTRPSILEKLSKYSCYIFDSRESSKIRGLRADNGYTTCTVINAGGSVAINGMSVAFNLGFDELHMFGLDLMAKDRAQTHAKGIAGKSITFNWTEVEVKGETIQTTPSMIDFANQVLDIVSIAHEQGLLKSIKFYGDSLVTRMWDGVWHEEGGNNVLLS